MEFEEIHWHDVIATQIIKTYVITPIKVNGDSMNPTLEDGEIMILDIVSYKLKGLKRTQTKLLILLA